METERPNPDALLAEVNAAAARERRGRLKIFFGASAGVGKTYAMLTAAHEQMRAGTDVVVGLLETHGRAETAALLDGLQQLPPLMLDVQGTHGQGIRPGCGAGAPADAHPGRRTGAYQCARCTAPEALAGRRRIAGRRHRRVHDAQRPAHRKPQRCRGADHRHPRQRNVARHVLRVGRRSRTDRPAARRTARPSARGQGVRAAAGRARAREFFPEGQPDRAARNGVASDCGPRRRADARIPRREVDRTGMGGGRAHRRRHRPGPAMASNAFAPRSGLPTLSTRHGTRCMSRRRGSLRLPQAERNRILGYLRLAEQLGAQDKRVVGIVGRR